MAKLAHTSESVIYVGLIVLNLDKWLREVLFWLKTSFAGGNIIARVTYRALEIALCVQLNSTIATFTAGAGTRNHNLAA
ncbi:MAG: hypothetical protein GXP30_09085 [Verrucomicrobia bacterium]|nr:hypothetical protein [Verrucomicrobiota bacterium]